MVAIARFDSFTRTALVLLRTLSLQGFAARLVTTEPPPTGDRAGSQPPVAWSQVSERSAIGDVVRQPDVGQADVLILCLDGRTIMAALRALREWPSGRRRPVLVAAYPGIILRDRVKGLMARAPVDLLCLNSEADLSAYRESAAALGGDAGNAVVTGPPALWCSRRGPAAGGDAGEGAIVFFEQPNIPRNRDERAYVADRLLDLAARFPETEVALKPRTKPGLRTFHDCPHPMSRLLEAAGRGRRPPNLTVTSEPVHRLLPRTRIALAFSSTVAIEAMTLGIPTRILVDLGLSERLGTAFFAGSGALARFRDIHPGLPATADPAWLRSVCGPGDGPARFIAAIGDALAKRAADAPWPFRPLSPFYGLDEWLHFLDHAGGVPRARHRPPLLGRVPALLGRGYRYCVRSYS